MRRSRVLLYCGGACAAVLLVATMLVGGGIAPGVLPALLQVGHLNRALPEMSVRDATALAVEATTACTHLVRLGHAGEGGWTVCLDGLHLGRPTAPASIPVPNAEAGELALSGLDKQAPPAAGAGHVVYSFGVRDDWSFDVAAAAIGFRVFSFDPTVRPEEAPEEEPGVTFRSWALAATDSDAPAGAPVWSKDPALWTRRSLATIMDVLGHTHVAVLKADIEWGEWEILPSLIATVFRDGRVGQLLLEVHLTHDVDENARLVGILRQLRDVGFEVFHREDNVMWGEFVRVGRTGPVVRCCFNISWRWHAP